MMAIWRNYTGACNHITCHSGGRFCPRWLLWFYNRTPTPSTRDESTCSSLHFTAHQLRNDTARTLGRNLKRNQQGSHHWLARSLAYSTQDHLLGRGTSHSGLPHHPHQSSIKKTPTQTSPCWPFQIYVYNCWEFTLSGTRKGTRPGFLFPSSSLRDLSRSLVIQGCGAVMLKFTSDPTFHLPPAGRCSQSRNLASSTVVGLVDKGVEAGFLSWPSLIFFHLNVLYQREIVFIKDRISSKIKLACIKRIWVVISMMERSSSDKIFSPVSRTTTGQRRWSNSF